MNPPLSVFQHKARELRREFDDGFARPEPPPPPAVTTFLLVRAGGAVVALRQSEMTGFAPAENLTPVPGRTPAFLGIASLRNALHPVWSLASLLGRTAAATPAGWFVLGGTPAAPCAFACEAYERFISAPETATAAGSATVPWQGDLVPIVSLPALLTEIKGRKAATPSPPP